MDAKAMVSFLLDAFPGVETTEAFGYKFFFYADERRLPFATLASSDNEHDRVSNLDRPGVFRLNIGVSRETFQDLFGASKVDVSSYDFTELDRIMPHPDYAAQNFVCVLNPEESLEAVRSLLTEAYGLAVRRHERRQPTGGSETDDPA
ncbi:DUF6194 family protein [Tautonia plasticadhaerens]|uniref:DUF6194 domain-containing protein n=1 Tax=Tautonia plasticadhaerens TaxID=2527974 RepID=A0A518H1X5_9BACT|nr:DUF6194 family protein [Tautonia plasticadhaerens]QDV34814.1 hypothetical protein ElP_27110 [Tautonia plasticadhaerens]